MLAFLAGDKKTALQNTSFVLMGSFYTYEESQAQVGTYESALKLNKMEEDRMMDIIAKETNQDVTKIRELWKEGTVLTTEQAKELGLIHSISNTLPLLAPQPAKENKSEGLIN